MRLNSSSVSGVGSYRLNQRKNYVLHGIDIKKGTGNVCLLLGSPVVFYPRKGVKGPIRYVEMFKGVKGETKR